MKGIRRHGLGWQASVYVAGVGREYQPFPIDTPEAEMQAWRKSTRQRLELQRPALDGYAAAGTFTADAKRYLSSVTAMPDYKGRVYDIGLWVELFGSRRRATIKPHEVRSQRDKWLTVGPKRIYNRKDREWRDVVVPLAASTVNHRLRALENLYTVLSPGGYNPVKSVPEAQEPDADDRSLRYDLIDTILAVMPDRGRGLKGQPRSTVSKSKARLKLMAYTGLTHAQVMALTPADLDVQQPAVRVLRRQKGKGAAGGWKPLLREARPALEAFMAADAWGTFSRDALRQSWHRACAKLNVPKCRPYDLRHSYATAILQQTGDLKALQELLSHADSRTSARYSKRAVPSWLAATVAKVKSLRQPIVPADVPRGTLRKYARARSSIG